MTPKARLDRVLAGHLTPLLAPRGFRKGGSVYRAQRDGAWWMVDVQESRWSAPGEVGFTLNGGVYVPGVLHLYARRPEPKTPAPADCCLVARVGMLTPERKDLWWTLAADSDAGDDEAGAAAAAATERFLLPFLARVESAADAARLLEEAGPELKHVLPMDRAIRLAYAGIIHHLLGDAPASRARLEAAARAGAGGPLEEHLQALRDRLG